MTRTHTNAGFTLIELMIVVAIIAIIASIAIPKLLAARISANEAACISTLRSISSGQAQIRSSAVIDSDSDGSGEYAYFGEMSGAVPMRIDGGGTPAAGAATDKLNPPVLSSSFGSVNGGVVTRSGYEFQLWLPGATAGGLTPGIPEDPTGGKLGPPFPNPNNCENMWCCYAWPMQANGAGNRAFFINQEGDMVQTLNRNPSYSGTTKMPLFDEAYKVLGDMASGMRVGSPAGGHDNTVWVPVQ